MKRLAEESERFVERFDSDAITATHDYYLAMEALGDAAGAPIVEERLRKVSALARECGGAAKPSGAGGGDVALAVFDSTDAASRFESAAKVADIEILDVPLGGPGVRVEG